jgi:hypothetical protein
MNLSGCQFPRKPKRYAHTSCSGKFFLKFLHVSSKAAPSYPGGSVSSPAKPPGQFIAAGPNKPRMRLADGDFPQTYLFGPPWLSDGLLVPCNVHTCYLLRLQTVCLYNTASMSLESTVRHVAKTGRSSNIPNMEVSKRQM